MPTSNYMPDVQVEIAFDSGVGTPAASRTWTDVSAYVELQELITITRGRQDEQGTVTPSSMTLTLDNRDGRFTPGKTSGAYYPNVKVGRPVRVKATYSAVTYTRFVGYISDWDVSWPDGTNESAVCTITAASRLALLDSLAELRSVVEEEISLDNPLGLYTCGEAEGAFSAANSSDTNQPPARLRWVAPNVTFGTATGPGTDDLTAASFTGGKFLRAWPVSGLNAATSAWCGGFFAIPTAAVCNLYTLGWQSGGLTQELSVSMDGSGFIVAKATADDGTTATVTSGVSAAGGSTHHALAVWVAGTGLKLYVDGVLIGTSGATFAGKTMTFDQFNLGGHSLVDSYNVPTGTLAHGYFGTGTSVDATRAAAHSGSGLTGFVGEAAGDRIERYAAYAAIPAAEISADTGSETIAHIPLTDASVLDVMRRVETAEDGLLLDAKDGTLRFQGRSYRYSRSVALTLAADQQQVEAALSPSLDTSDLLNDVTATNGSGSLSARAQDTTSQSDYGVVRASVEVWTDDTSGDAVLQAAWWRVNRHKDPGVRNPSLDVDLINAPSSVIPNLLTAEISDRISLTGLPAQAPSASEDYFLEGYTERIGPESYGLSFNVTPAALWNVWVLEDATYGAYDTYMLSY